MCIRDSHSPACRQPASMNTHVRLSVCLSVVKRGCAISGLLCTFCRLYRVLSCTLHQLLSSADTLYMAYLPLFFAPSTLPNASNFGPPYIYFTIYTEARIFTARQHSCKRCTSYRKSVRPSVCLSVCPSQSGTVSKRLKLGSWDLHWRIAP